MTNRRGFLSSIIAAAAAPAIVSASSIMRVTPMMDAYKYDINFDGWVREADSNLLLRPSRLIVPATMMEECLKILNQEFDRSYTAYMGKA